MCAIWVNSAKSLFAEDLKLLEKTTVSGYMQFG